MFLIVAEEKAESRCVAIFLKLPGRVPCLYQSVKPLLTSHLWLCEYLSLQKGHYWRKTRRKVFVFFFSITPWCIRQRKTCNSSIPKEVLLFGLADLKPKVFVPPPPPLPLPLHPSFPPSLPSLSAVCRKVQHSGRACLYQFPWIPHSDKILWVLHWDILSAREAELHSCGYCYCYFRNASLLSILKCAFFMAEVLLFKSRRRCFRINVRSFRGMEGEAYFLSNIGLCQHYDGRLLLLQGKNQLLWYCVYIFPFFSTFCVVILI